ncbi:hypothetical protein [Halopseudomonas salina]|uniref:Methyl-accepting chemotaxis protein n=2 Tax=Halopseudomonas salina TaxID=1323744 RepID=A0ABQ1PEI1_9GAMM|nr:hypothetical protein [Halopseudomonas salina]GGC95692.1 hypothetical protein GCM10007418_14030 [Halopseudomonas salina]
MRKLILLERCEYGERGNNQCYSNQGRSQMTLRKKFVLTLTVVLLSFIAATVIFSSVTQGKWIHDQALAEATHRKNEAARLLGLTDSIMSERVKNSMQLLIQRGMTIGDPSLGQPVSVGTASPPELQLGGQPQANNFALVDGLRKLWAGLQLSFLAKVTTSYEFLPT